MTQRRVEERAACAARMDGRRVGAGVSTMYEAAEKVGLDAVGKEADLRSPRAPLRPLLLFILLQSLYLSRNQVSRFSQHLYLLAVLRVVEFHPLLNFPDAVDRAAQPLCRA